jgi:hypothetical protein
MAGAATLQAPPYYLSIKLMSLMSHLCPCVLISRLVSPL